MKYKRFLYLGHPEMKYKSVCHSMHSFRKSRRVSRTNSRHISSYFVSRVPFLPNRDPCITMGPHLPRSRAAVASAPKSFVHSWGTSRSTLRRFGHEGKTATDHRRPLTALPPSRWTPGATSGAPEVGEKRTNHGRPRYDWTPAEGSRPRLSRNQFRGADSVSAEQGRQWVSWQFCIFKGSKNAKTCKVPSSHLTSKLMQLETLSYVCFYTMCLPSPMHSHIQSVYRSVYYLETKTTRNKWMFAPVPQS